MRDTKYRKVVVYTGCEGGATGFHCAWDARECAMDQTAVFHDSRCHCGQVQTGACIRASGSDYYCAVTKGSCDDKSSYRTPLELRNEGKIDCRLCDAMYQPTDEGIPPVGVAAIAIAVVGFLSVAAAFVICRYRKSGSDTSSVLDGGSESKEVGSII